jgi:hypothetical protein
MATRDRPRQLLGGPEHGRWLIAPADPAHRIERRYLNSLILVTMFETNCHGRLRAKLVEFNGDYIEEALLHSRSERPAGGRRLIRLTISWNQSSLFEARRVHRFVSGQVSKARFPSADVARENFRIARGA